MDLISGLRQAAAKKKLKEQEAARKAAEEGSDTESEVAGGLSDAAGGDEHDSPVSP